MPKRRIRPSLLVACAVLVLLAALGPTHAAASSDAETEPPAADAITTVLHPGWNMVGWVGPSTPTSELFDEIASLRQVSAWDALAKEYRRARRDGHAPLPTLAPGMGLWLLLGGNASVEWTRPVSHEAVLLSLHAGLNLVGWTGENGTAIEDAVFRFGEAFVRASRWSAEALKR